MIIECPACQSRFDTSGRPAGTRARCRCGHNFQLPEPPKSAGGLSCPSCGAATQSDAARCSYCESPLALASCPRCFGMLFAGSKHCQHCGAKADQPARAIPEGTESPRGCPRCNKHPHLIATMVGEVLLDECTSCGGIFVDTASFERVVADREKQSALHEAEFPKPAAHDNRLSSADTSQVTYIHCPDCHAMMNRSNFGKSSGVIVDICPAHGVWFDRDELRRVVDFIIGGGLERARVKQAAELDRRIQDKKTIASMDRAMHNAYPRGYRDADTALDLVEVGVDLLGALGRFLR